MRSLLFPALLALVPCAFNSAAGLAAPTEDATRQAERGLAFARAHCSGCHAVEPLRLSPNPEAPLFETIVNAPGLTGATLKAFLRDSHNFPDIMDFNIDPAQIDALAAYMLTLRKRD